MKQILFAFGAWFVTMLKYGGRMIPAAELFKLMKESGYNGVGLAGWGDQLNCKINRGPDDPPPLTTKEQIRFVTELAAEYGLEVPEMAIWVWSPDPRTHGKQWVAGVKAGIDCCANCGIPIARIDTGIAATIGMTTVQEDELMDVLVPLWQEVMAYAKAKGVIIAAELEPCWVLLNKPSTAMRFRKRIGLEEAWGWCHDVAHAEAIRKGRGQTGETYDTVEAYLDAIGPENIVSMHLATNPGGELHPVADASAVIEHPDTGLHGRLDRNDPILKEHVDLTRKRCTRLGRYRTQDLCRHPNGYPDAVRDDLAEAKAVYASVA